MMGMIEIRRIEERDGQALRSFLLRQTTFQEINGQTPEQFCEEIEQDVASAGTISLVVYEEGRLVAVIDLLERHPRDGSLWVGLLLVEETLWGRGYGRRIYETLETEWMRPLNPVFRLGVIPTNERARRFWTRQGYRYEREGVTGNGVVVDVMCKDTASSDSML